MGCPNLRPSNIDVAPGAGTTSFTPGSATCFCSARPGPIMAHAILGSCWQVRSQLRYLPRLSRPQSAWLVWPFPTFTSSQTLAQSRSRRGVRQVPCSSGFRPEMRLGRLRVVAAKVNGARPRVQSMLHKTISAIRTETWQQRACQRASRESRDRRDPVVHMQTYNKLNQASAPADRRAGAVAL